MKSNQSPSASVDHHEKITPSAIFIVQDAAQTVAITYRFFLNFIMHKAEKGLGPGYAT